MMTQYIRCDDYILAYKIIIILYMMYYDDESSSTIVAASFTKPLIAL